MSIKDPLQKSELRFWLPIIISIVSVTLSWGALTTRMALMEQKQDDILAGIEEIKAAQQRYIAGLNDVNKRLAQLEAIHYMKGGE